MISARSIETRVIDEQGPAFATAEILGLMERLRSQRAERAKITAPVFAEEAVCVILHHCECRVDLQSP